MPPSSPGPASHSTRPAGLLAAIRGGRVVGATVATHPIDEREYVHVFIVKWRTKGKVARFVIDGRKYRHPDAVLADMEEASPNYRAFISQPRSRPPDRPDPARTTTSSWQEFREQLTSDQDSPP